MEIEGGQEHLEIEKGHEHSETKHHKGLEMKFQPKETIPTYQHPKRPIPTSETFSKVLHE